MGEINLSIREKDALKSVDRNALGKTIDRALDGESLADFHRMRLADCGPYVAGKLSAFETAIRRYRDAKSARKVSETRESAVRAGYTLSNAFAAMVDRMKTEERFDELFHVDDDNFRPHHHHPDIDIKVSFRWRKTVDEAWTYGAITFSHTYRARSRYGDSAPKRKPSAAKREAALQEEIAREWKHLYKTALYTVRDYFQAGGDGSTIPKTFRAVTDSQGSLNNFSARWWQEKPKDPD
ncbi:hypothetical protein [Bosea sp. BH3]|uniref:hypothetical protein n=1 Tax=Bosea sp. BH3 TaxID=2871701 RepID=UPI0021CB2F37|nr:hypothetical protein [Bosea sp. BH3]MCU4180178.1 hypothetical protein [Bosea sp. BH3]